MKSRDTALLKVLSSDRYKVTTDGKIFEKSSGLERLPTLDNQSMRVVNLSECGTVRVARLVALQYLGDGNGRQVVHRNGDKQDDCVTNLRWSTPKETSALAHKRGLVPHPIGNFLPTTKLTPDQVIEIKRRLLVGGTSHRKLAEEFGVTRGAIGGIKYGKSWCYLKDIDD